MPTFKHYRRRKTNKAPRKRVFIMNMTKYPDLLTDNLASAARGVGSGGPGGFVPGSALLSSSGASSTFPHPAAGNGGGNGRVSAPEFSALEHVIEAASVWDLDSLPTVAAPVVYGTKSLLFAEQQQQQQQQQHTYKAVAKSLGTAIAQPSNSSNSSFTSAFSGPAAFLPSLPDAGATNIHGFQALHASTINSASFASQPSWGSAGAAPSCAGLSFQQPQAPQPQSWGAALTQFTSSSTVSFSNPALAAPLAAVTPVPAGYSVLTQTATPFPCGRAVTTGVDSLKGAPAARSVCTSLSDWSPEEAAAFARAFSAAPTGAKGSVPADPNSNGPNSNNSSTTMNSSVASTSFGTTGLKLFKQDALETTYQASLPGGAKVEVVDLSDHASTHTLQQQQQQQQQSKSLAGQFLEPNTASKADAVAATSQVKQPALEGADLLNTDQLPFTLPLVDAPTQPAMLGSDAAAKGGRQARVEIACTRLVSSGAYGVVYSAQWGDVEVAVKMMRMPAGKQGLLLGDVQRSFEVEAAMLCSLQHENIVPVYHAQMTSPVCIVQEFAPYGTLSDYIHGPVDGPASDLERAVLGRLAGRMGLPLSELLAELESRPGLPTAGYSKAAAAAAAAAATRAHANVRNRRRYVVLLCLLLDVATAFSYLAGLAQPVVHHDVKPANMLLAASGAALLADFGVAKAASAGTRQPVKPQLSAALTAQAAAAAAKQSRAASASQAMSAMQLALQAPPMWAAVLPPAAPQLAPMGSVGLAAQLPGVLQQPSQHQQHQQQWLAPALCIDEAADHDVNTMFTLWSGEKEEDARSGVKRSAAAALAEAEFEMAADMDLLDSNLADAIDALIADAAANPAKRARHMVDVEVHDVELHLDFTATEPMLEVPELTADWIDSLFADDPSDAVPPAAPLQPLQQQQQHQATAPVAASPELASPSSLQVDKAPPVAPQPGAAAAAMAAAAAAADASSVGAAHSDSKNAKQQSRGMHGTAHYAAPESLVDNGHPLTVGADVFSFGYCIWEALNGQRPWSGSQAANIIRCVGHQDSRLPISRAWSLRMQCLVRRCWQTDPALRPSAADVLGVLDTEIKEVLRKWD